MKRKLIQSLALVGMGVLCLALAASTRHQLGYPRVLSPFAALAGAGAALLSVGARMAWTAQRPGDLLALRVALWRGLATAGAVGGALGRNVSPRMAVAILSPLALYVAGFVLFSMPHMTLYAGDSSTYLMFSNYRPVGYPLFLRFVLWLSSSPFAIAAAQLALGIGANLIFAGAVQAVFRNLPLTLLVGALLLLGWDSTSYAYFVLSDSPFISLMTLHTAMVLLCLRRATALRLALIGILTVAAISIRPAGFALYLTLPYLLLVLPHRGKIIIWCGSSTVLATLLLCSAHLFLFGYFGLSSFGGYNTGAATLFLMEADTPSGRPDLARQFHQAGLPYQQRLRQIPDCYGRMMYVLAEAAPMINLSQAITTDYLHQRPELITRPDNRNQQAFLDWLNETSPGNREMKALGVWSNGEWNAINAVMGELGAAATAHNPLGFAELIGCKAVYAWGELFSAGKIPHQMSAPITPLTGQTEQELLTFDIPLPGSSLGGQPFDRTASVIFGLRLFPTRWLLPVSGIVSCILLAAAVLRRRTVSPELAGMAYAFLMLLAHIALICIGGTPIPRYLLPLLPLTFLSTLAVTLLPPLYHNSRIHRLMRARTTLLD